MKEWNTPIIEELDINMTMSGDIWEAEEGVTTYNKIGEPRTGAGVPDVPIPS